MKSLDLVKGFIIKIDIREIHWNVPAADENGAGFDFCAVSG